MKITVMDYNKQTGDQHESPESVMNKCLRKLSDCSHFLLLEDSYGLKEF